jgi:gliding motility-associated-like protein
MIRFVIFLVMLSVLFRAHAQFAIVNENGQAISEVTIISGVALQLNSNFEQVRGVEVIFSENHRTSSDIAYEIGFPFSFYDNTYSDYFIGANGYITFNNPPDPLYAYTLPVNGIPINQTDPQYPTNSVFGAFRGWDVEGGLYVTRLSADEYPNRKLIITWCETPAINVDSSGTFQIVLHESGIIDIHLVNIPFSSYAGNNTGSGIQSVNPFQGLAVPDRNYGPWPPADSESYRFTWQGSNYSVQNIPYSPVAVAEHIDWYEIEGPGTRRWLGSGKQLLVSPKQTTTYQAELTACWGQTIATAELRVIVEGVFPTAFNPNSTNEANRTFKMPAVPGAIISNFRLQVYNRWGQIVFETTDANTGWDGTMRNSGQECPSGIYNWIMMVEDDGKSPISNSGMVVLIR